jgi:hypothetical protein
VDDGFWPKAVIREYSSNFSGRATMSADEAKPPKTPPCNGEVPPWLTRDDWVKREVTYVSPADSPIVAAAGLACGAVAIGTALMGDFQLGAQNRDNFVSTLVRVLLFGGLFLGYLYSWFNRRLFGKSVCRLITLPGVIGGWFKANVEVALPSRPLHPVSIRLENCRIGRGRETYWEMNCAVEPSAITEIGPKKFVIPVHLRVPKNAKQVETVFGWDWKGAWFLHLRATFPNMDYKAYFIVPIYTTDQAPVQEQLPE